MTRCSDFEIALTERDPDSWNMPLTLPINYPSLPLDARLAITLWDIEKAGKGIPVGGSCLYLFSDKGSVESVCSLRRA